MAAAQSFEDKEFAGALKTKAATKNAFLNSKKEKSELKKMQQQEVGEANTQPEGEKVLEQPLVLPVEVITLDSDADADETVEGKEEDSSTDFDDANPDANADADAGQDNGDSTNSAHGCRDYDGSDKDGYEEADKECDTSNPATNDLASQTQQAPLRKNSRNSSSSNNKTKRNEPPSAEPRSTPKVHSKRPRLTQSAQCSKCAHDIDKIEQLNSEIVKKKLQNASLQAELVKIKDELEKAEIKAKALEEQKTRAELAVTESEQTMPLELPLTTEEQKMKELKTENQGLRLDMDKCKLELKILTLSNSVQRLESILGRLLEQVGERVEDYSNKTVSKNGQQNEPELKLEAQVKTLQNLSLGLSKLLEAWEEFNPSAYDNTNQIEDAILYFWYDTDNLELEIEEAEKDLMWKQEQLAPKVQAEALSEQVEAQPETSKDQAEKISKLHAKICQFEAELKAVQTKHNEEVAKLSGMIMGLQSGKKDDLNDNLMNFLMKSAQDYQKKAAVGEQKIAQLENELFQLKSKDMGVIENTDHLLEVVSRRDARIEKLETSIQNLLPSLQQKRVRKSINETLLPPSPAPEASCNVVVAASTGCPSASAVFDSGTINAMQKKDDTGGLGLFLSSNVALLTNTDDKEDDERNDIHDETTIVYDFTARKFNITTHSTVLEADVVDEREKEDLDFLSSSFPAKTPTLQLVKCNNNGATENASLALPPSPIIFPRPSTEITQRNTQYSTSDASVATAKGKSVETQFKSCHSPTPNVQRDEEKLEIANKQLESLAKRKTTAVNPPLGRQCDVCGKTCSNKSNLKQHINLKHLGIGKVRCSICKAGPFMNQSNLNTHVKRAHGKGDARAAAKGKKKTKVPHNTGTSNNGESGSE